MVDLLQKDALRFQSELRTRFLDQFGRQAQLLGERGGILSEHRQANLILAVEMIAAAGLKQQVWIHGDASQFLEQRGPRRRAEPDRAVRRSRPCRWLQRLRRRGQVFAPFQQQVIAQPGGSGVHHVDHCFSTRQSGVQLPGFVGDAEHVGMLSDRGNGLSHAGVFRHLPAFHFQRGLQDRGHSRSAERMTDLARHGCHHQRFFTLFRLEDFCRGFRIGRVRFGIRKAGGFEHRHLRGINAARLQGPPGGGAEILAILAAIGGGGDAPNHAEDPVAIPSGVFEALEQHDADAFRRNHGAAVLVINGLRLAVREHPLQFVDFVDVEVHVALTGSAQDEIGRAVQQQADARVDGRHRRRVAAVHRQRAAHHVECFRQARRQRAGRKTPGLVQQSRHVLEQRGLVALGDGFDLLLGNAAFAEFVPKLHLKFGDAQAHLQLAGEVSAECRTDDHRGPGAVERLLIVAGFPQRLVRGVQQHELQGIGVVDLLRCDFVLLPIVDEVVDIPAPGRAEPPGSFAGRRVVKFLVPAVQRSFRLRIAARNQQVPVGVHRQGARENRCPADDRHGTLVPFFRRQRPVRADLRRHRALRLQRGRRGVVHHDMHVQAPDAERVHRSPPRLAGRRFGPVARLTIHFERDVFPVDVRVRRLKIDLARQEPVLQAQDGLHQAGDPGGFQRMADVGLHAADRQFAVLGQLPLECHRQRG